MHNNSANCIRYRLFTVVAGQEGIFESASHTINAITPGKLYESTLPLALEVTGVSLESFQDPLLAVALYGSNEYSYSVVNLLTTVCTQWVPCASVFTFYALHSFPFQ